jgi:diaminopimelate epimerase
VSSSPVSAPARKLRVFKYQALGNSYLIVDPRYCPDRDALFESGDGDPRPSARLVEGLCDKSYGIGSNGLLFGPVGASEASVFRLRIINSDGTPAGFSGNGVRIFAQYLRDAGYVRTGDHFSVEILEQSSTAAPIRNIAPVRLLDTPDQRIEVDVPYAPRFGSMAIAASPAHVREAYRSGLAGNLSYTVAPLADAGARLTGLASAWSSSTLLDIGNPHCVTFVEQDRMPGMAELIACNEALRAIAFRPAATDRTSAVFANGANLQWACAPDRAHLALAIYERGEGPTMASGSSASAAASAAFARGLIDSAVNVVMPGGTLAVRLKGSADNITAVTLSGYATRILDGAVDLDIFV